MYGTSESRLFDPTTRSKLDRWVAAKREKDFGTADAIRSELRALGIEPDAVRPPDRDKDRVPEAPPTVAVDPFIKAKLDRWVSAKREKDFGTADAIRAELHAVGLEPDQLRPNDRDVGLSATSSNLPGARFDLDTEAKLDQWVQAKREKDWSLADSIRSELRALGIEPDVVRPPDRDLQPTVQLDPTTEAKLDRWVLAKREKDFGTADAIRQELRAAGLEPDSLRPADRDVPSLSKNAAKVHDPYTEAQLDRWVQAKRDKDFSTADAIRAELRARGIEPDLVRPSDRDTQAQMQQQQQESQSQLAAQYAALQAGGFPVVPGLNPSLATAPGLPGLPAELVSGLPPELVPGLPSELVSGLPPELVPGVPPELVPGLPPELAGQGWGGFLGAAAALDPSQAAFSMVGAPGQPALLGSAVDQAALLGSAVDQAALLGQAAVDQSALFGAALDPSVLSGQLAQQQQLQLSASLISRVSTRIYDGETEALLDRWVAAKREKDFAAADSIRAELRAKGIEPDSVRPSDKDLREKQALRPEPPVPTTQTQWGSLAALNLSPGLQREVERQLDRWAEARIKGDLKSAETIARVLRSKGIDPEVARPAGADLDEGPAAKRARGSF